MATCGVLKYDKLPGRVGFIDVDAARGALSRYFAVVKILEKKLDKAVKLNKEKSKGR